MTTLPLNYEDKTKKDKVNIITWDAAKTWSTKC